MNADQDITDSSRPVSSLDTLKALHARQGELCDMMESLADKLPSAQRAACLEAAWAATTIIGPLHALEETCFFPLLQQRLASAPHIQVSIDRSLQEHAEDRDATLEIVGSLKRLADGCPRPEIDPISYQLRAFFVGLRRHQARELEVLFPVAMEKFTAEDQFVLEEALARGFGAEIRKR